MVTSLFPWLPCCWPSSHVLVPVAGFGLNEPEVTPFLAGGRQGDVAGEAARGWIVIVVVPCEDRLMVKLVGDADKLKLAAAGAVTSERLSRFCVTLPPAPVIVIVYVPVAVVEATAMVMVEVPEPGAAIDVGLKLTVTPVGWPVAVKATAESKPPETVVVIVDVPLLPCTTETEWARQKG